MKKLMFLLCLAGLSLACVAQDLQKVHAFDLDRVRLLDGPLKKMQELHRLHIVGELEPDRLLFPFRKNANLKQPAGVTGGYGGWDESFITGHYAGHYLSAAACMYAATGDKSFYTKANYMVAELEKCQLVLGGGYLSAFPAAWFDKLENAPTDASVPFYTIHKILQGLVDVAKFCQNDTALRVACNMADYFSMRLSKLSAQQIEAMLKTGLDGHENPLNEFGAMSAALAKLFLLAEQKNMPDAGRFLKLAAVFNREWLIKPLLNGEDILNSLHGNTHIAQALGFIDIGLAANNNQLIKAADNFWKLVVNHHSFVNGSNAFNEKLRAANVEVAGTGNAQLDPLTSESCNTHNMLKLSLELFTTTPDATYGDYYENALYNHILAAYSPEGKLMYHMSMRPGDFRNFINEPYCCQGTGIESTAHFGDAIYFHNDSGLWVNLYVPSQLDWKEKGIMLKQVTRYPENGVVNFTISTGTPKKTGLYFRVPRWLEDAPELRVNGKKITLKYTGGNFIAVDRLWKNGDAVQLTFHLQLRVRKALDDSTVVSFFNGPLLLAGKLGTKDMPGNLVGSNVQLSKQPVYTVPHFENTSLSTVAKKIDRVSPVSFRAAMTDSTGNNIQVQLAPFYMVQQERYSLYWKIKH